MEPRKKPIVCELFNDNFQNFKRYGIPKAQLVIADMLSNCGRYIKQTESEQIRMAL